jgi:tRNA(Ile)-lysidine synthase
MDLSRPLAMVSGGPDSVALLRALVEIGSRPVVLHVDHGLRGEESREDARFVRELCERLEVPCIARSIEVGGGNVQDEARRERYLLAEEIMGEHGLSVVATGHTADDVAETVLLNLARGSGLRGLSGIPPVRGRVVRPLIENRRAEILTYLSLLNQPYRTDPTNLTPKYARNRVRLEVLPVLEELYPGAGGNIARAASLLREDLEVLEGLVAGRIRQRGEEVVMPLDELWKMPPALRRHAVRRGYAALTFDEGFLDSVAVENVLDLAGREGGTRVAHLPGGVVAAVRFGKEISLYHQVESFSGEKDLLVGEQAFDGWLLNVREVRGHNLEDAVQPEVAYLDASRGPYRVRMAREGDTIRPLSLGGTKKVYKAMKDRKVPKDLRSRTPVVVDGRGRVAWVFGGELGEEFRVRTGTMRTLRVEVERIP